MSQHGSEDGRITRARKAHANGLQSTHPNEILGDLLAVVADKNETLIQQMDEIATLTNEAATYRQHFIDIDEAVREMVPAANLSSGIGLLTVEIAIRSLQAESAALRLAVQGLRGYIEHKPKCNVSMGVDYEDCDCGCDAALAALPAEGK